MAAAGSIELIRGRPGAALPAQALTLRLAHIRQSPALSAFLPARLPGADGAGAETCKSEQASSRSDSSPSDVEPCAHKLGATWRLAFGARGCREVQQKLEFADDELRVVLAEELRGHICDAVRSPHANYVVQKCIEVLRPAAFQFIIDELMGDSLLHVAWHKFGCRVVMRLLEHGLPDQVHQVVGALMPGISSLAQHRYGNYVVQSMISRSAVEQRGRIVDALRREIAEMCQDQFGSSVVRTVLASGGTSESALLATAILESRGLVERLARSQRGRAIVRLVAGLLGMSARSLTEDAAAASALLSASKVERLFGQRVAQDLSSAELPPAAIRAGA